MLTSMKFKLPTDLKADLVAQAERESESEATIIRRALRAYLARAPLREHEGTEA